MPVSMRAVEGVFPLPPSCRRRRRRHCRSIESQAKKGGRSRGAHRAKSARREEASIVCSLWREDRRGADGFIHQVISGWTPAREREREESEREQETPSGIKKAQVQPTM